MFKRHETVEVLMQPPTDRHLWGSCGTVVDTLDDGTVRVLFVDPLPDPILPHGVYGFRPEQLNLVFGVPPFGPPTLWNRFVWNHMLRETWDKELDERVAAVS